MDEPQVEIIRSARRRRSVSASWTDGRIVVRAPAAMSGRELDAMVPGLVARVMARRESARFRDEDLQARALLLAERYFDGAAVPSSVRWVTNQQHRWGSCTPSQRTIRISSRLQGAPQYVLDHVLVHELAHLIERGHGPEFRRLTARYEHAERAEAFLAGASFAAGWGAQTALDEPPLSG